MFCFISFKAGHVISPEECTAKPSKPQNAEKVKLWKSIGNDSSCNDFDSNLIDQKWVEKAGNLSIGMYAFRFDSSDEVIITCTAFVCSSSDKSSNCTQLCVTASQQSLNRRRRYAIVGPQRTEKSASASFRVVPKDNPNVATESICLHTPARIILQFQQRLFVSLVSSTDQRKQLFQESSHTGMNYRITYRILMAVRHSNPPHG
ncbi:unnamed protein product [Mytilus edulis]|uniref:ZP domain-containing protein n=1 Tax=Mytilus edulis TaxID=6550 RepID=A0A8S3PXP0_MYTED|nr:unnamed protein product [Mytilus edulis]